MHRRGFLRLLGLGTASAIVLPSLRFEWAQTASAAEPLVHDTFRWMCRELALDLGERYGPVRHSTAQLIGADGLVSQYSLSLPRLQDFDGLTVQEARTRYLEPSVQFLAQRMGQRGPITACGELSLPDDMVLGYRVSVPSGWSVRGVQMYNVYADDNLTRFDVLVAD